MFQTRFGIFERHFVSNLLVFPLSFGAKKRVDGSKHVKKLRSIKYLVIHWFFSVVTFLWKENPSRLEHLSREFIRSYFLGTKTKRKLNLKLDLKLCSRSCRGWSISLFNKTVYLPFVPKKIQNSPLLISWYPKPSDKCFLYFLCLNSGQGELYFLKLKTHIGDLSLQPLQIIIPRAFRIFVCSCWVCFFFFFFVLLPLLAKLLPWKQHLPLHSSTGSRQMCSGRPSFLPGQPWLFLLTCERSNGI